MEELKIILERLETIENKITDIQMTLEHETNQNIQIIAEYHAILNRKLDDVLRVDNEKEMLLISGNRLENELSIMRLKNELSRVRLENKLIRMKSQL